MAPDVIRHSALRFVPRLRSGLAQDSALRGSAQRLRRELEALSVWGLAHLPRAPQADVPRKEETMAQIERDVIACRRCPLYRTRTKPVPGEGSLNARLVFIGEAPGRDEDMQGRPFVGRAGQLLTKMIEAMGLRREEVYICNVLKDRPPNNRTPEPDEMAACLPFLERQLDLIQPRVICALGSIALKALLGPQMFISTARGRVHDYRGIPLVPTFHPAYLLRNPPAKKLAWADLKRVKQLLEQRDK
jgi:DNA polymerase